jgi:hypothetical protein
MTDLAALAKAHCLGCREGWPIVPFPSTEEVHECPDSCSFKHYACRSSDIRGALAAQQERIARLRTAALALLEACDRADPLQAVFPQQMQMLREALRIPDATPGTPAAGDDSKEPSDTDDLYLRNEIALINEAVGYLEGAAIASANRSGPSHDPENKRQWALAQAVKRLQAMTGSGDMIDCPTCDRPVWTAP